MRIMHLYPLVFSSLFLPSGAYAEPEDVLTVTTSKQSAHSASARHVSSTTVSASELNDAGVTGTAQLFRVLPGLNMEKSGSLLFPIVSLRGISSAQDFYNPAVSLYIDGVPQLATHTLQALTDVARVDMLRGPQGTLYGKSAQGGVINIVTQQPDGTPRGYLAGGIASRGGYHGKLNLSGPIQDGLLYGSVTLLRQVDAGAMTNPSTGHDRLGGSRANAGNVRLRLAPDGQPWETSLAISEDCTKSTQDTYVSFNNVKSRTLAVTPGYPDPYLRRCTHCQSLSGKYTTDDWMINLNTAWQQQNYRRDFPNGTLMAELPERWNQDVQELRAATYGDGRRVDMVFGLYRQNTREKLNLKYIMPSVVYRQTDSFTTAETLAAYSDLTWHTTERIDLGGGLRVSHDRASTQYQDNVLGTPFFSHNRTSDNQVLGQISAGYLLAENWRVYTRVAQGYKPAGFSISPPTLAAAKPYDAERSVNYELGTHYQTGSVSVQSALFHTHTRNMQLYSGPLGAQKLSNAGRSTATGIELNTQWQFTPGWSWDINGNVIRSEFSGDSELYHGKKVPFVPRYTAGTSVNGTLETPHGPLMPRLALRVVGPHYFDGDNALRQGTYITTDLRLGWQASDRVNIAGYMNNVFDRRYRTYGYLSGATGYAQVNDGRTVGVDVRIDLF